MIHCTLRVEDQRFTSNVDKTSRIKAIVDRVWVLFFVIKLLFDTKKFADWRFITNGGAIDVICRLKKSTD